MVALGALLAVSLIGFNDQQRGRGEQRSWVKRLAT